MKLDEFTQGYLDAALWSSMDDKDQPLDDNYNITSLSNATLDQAIKDCKAFQELNSEALDLYYQDYGIDYAGYDFWLTRNGHGVGFWDRVLNDDTLGERLTVASKDFGHIELYVGDDNQLYFDRPSKLFID